VITNLILIKKNHLKKMILDNKELKPILYIKNHIIIKVKVLYKIKKALLMLVMLASMNILKQVNQ